MKKKILVIGITMAAAGSEKSFLSFADAIDYEKYDVDLLLARKAGDFLSLVPKEIRILEMGKMGELFLIDRRNAKRIIGKRYLAKNPFRIFGLAPYLFQMKKADGQKARSFAANRLYLDYFKQCDKVVTVSEAIEKSLKSALPEITDRVVTLENIINRREILAKACEEADFGDDFHGIRLLSVGRICPQKGYDLAIPAIARLIREGYPVRLYIIGEGQREYVQRLEEQVCEAGISDAVRFLGVRQNPYPLMRAADIYLQPSRHEGRPIAVEEAKALCKPIFVTAYASAAEQMANGRLGLIGEISEEGIYGGLKRLLDEKELRDSFIKKLEELAKKEEKASAVMDIFE